jgi:hypothetical protein
MLFALSTYDKRIVGSSVCPSAYFISETTARMPTKLGNGGKGTLKVVGEINFG